MKIVLVHPQLNSGRLVPETPSRALLILGTMAKQRGHDVSIMHLDLVDFTEFINIDADLVAITCNTFQVKSARLVAKLAKEKGIKVVLGGPHAPAWNGAVPVDDVVIGEGESKWLEILGEKPDMEEPPVPDYSLVDLNRFCGVAPVGVSPSMAIMASRGCPFHCTFCNTPVFWGSKMRYRKPQDVVDEVELLHKQYGINEIFFQDDTFNLNHRWAFEIFDAIIQRKLNKEMVFKIDCRVNEKLLTEDFLALAARAGVWNIFYGIESGSQELLDRMKKGITIDEIKRAVSLTHKAGIHTQCSFIVGMPGESIKTLKETDALINEIQPSKYGWSFFCPFPRTEATEEVIAKGYIREMDYSEYGYGQVMARTDYLTIPELEAFKGFSYE